MSMQVVDISGKINIELTERTDYESDFYTKLIEDLKDVRNQVLPRCCCR